MRFTDFRQTYMPAACIYIIYIYMNYKYNDHNDKNGGEAAHTDALVHSRTYIINKLLFRLHNKFNSMLIRLRTFTVMVIEREKDYYRVKCYIVDALLTYIHDKMRTCSMKTLSTLSRVKHSIHIDE